LNLKTGEVKRYWPIRNCFPISIEKAVEDSSRILEGAFESASRRYDLALTVTAGYDTRVLLAACNKVRESIHYVTHTHANLDENGSDIRIPKKVLESFGLKHNIAYHFGDVDDDFRAIFRKNVTGAKRSTETNAYAFWKYFERLGKEMVVAEGEGGGLGKSFYRNRVPSYFKLNRRAVATLVQMRGSEKAEISLGEWLDSAKGAAEYGTNILDLLYWEMRLGNWSTLAISSYDMVFESFLPFNSRRIMECFIGVEEKFRLPPKYTHIYLVERMWPELLELPINPATNWVEAVKEKLRGKKCWAQARCLRFLFEYVVGFQ